MNPFQSVRGPKHDTSDGKTSGLSIQQARNLLGSIDTSHVVGLRDRALLGTLAYTGARIGAIARLRLGDLEDQGSQRVPQFSGRREASSARSLSAMTSIAGSESIWRRPGSRPAPKRPLCSGRPWETGRRCPDGPLSANDMRRLLKRRLKDAGLPPIFSPHSFRVLVVTDLLSQDVPLEDVQYLAGHANPRTTQIYDRRRRRVTRNIVERISV